MKKLICLLLVLALAIPFVGCASKEFEIVSCGSGFYFDSDKEYEIVELGTTTTGNYFYHEDYFYSESLGEKYTLKNGWFETHDIYLAKKSEHYNSEVYRFDLAEYHRSVLLIEPHMNYVELYSSNGTVNVQIQILSGRTTPVDLTLESVEIESYRGVPVLFSGATTDVNIIFKGENRFAAGNQTYTVEELRERMEDHLLGDQEQAFYDLLEEVTDEFTDGAGAIGDDLVDGMEHFWNGIAAIGTGVLDSVTNAVAGAIEGKDGYAGANGGDGILILGGLCVTGEGSFVVAGGSAANGSNATNSVTGDAKGGDGGNGGNGITSNAYLCVGDANVAVYEGFGGIGGEGSKGWLGAHGEDGANGKAGKKFNIAKPRQ